MNDLNRFLSALREFIELLGGNASGYAAKHAQRPTKDLTGVGIQHDESEIAYYGRLIKRSFVWVLAALIGLIAAGFFGADWPILLAVAATVVVLGAGFLFVWLPAGVFLEALAYQSVGNVYPRIVFSTLASVIVFGLYMSWLGAYLPKGMSLMLLMLALVVSIGASVSMIPTLFVWVTLGCFFLITVTGIGNWQRDVESRQTPGQKIQAEGADRQFRNAESTEDYVEAFLTAREANAGEVQGEILDKFCNRPDNNQQWSLCRQLPDMTEHQLQRWIDKHEKQAATAANIMEQVELTAPRIGRSGKYNVPDNARLVPESGRGMEHITVHANNGQTCNGLALVENRCTFHHPAWIQLSSTDGNRNFMLFLIQK